MASLWLIVLLLLLGWFWFDSLRAREIALGICRAACARQALQLLDETVALRRIGLRWGSEGIRLQRRYRFEFSAEGLERRNGYLILRGPILEALGFDPDC